MFTLQLLGYVTEEEYELNVKYNETHTQITQVTHTQTHKHTHIHTHTHAHTHTHTHTGARTHAHTQTNTHTMPEWKKTVLHVYTSGGQTATRAKFHPVCANTRVLKRNYLNNNEKL